MNIMPKLLFAAIAYIAASTAVDAADKGGPIIPAKPAEVIVVKSPFSGAYIGAHVGYSQLTDESDFNGYLGGGHIGFNAPMGGGFIAGLEIDGTMSAANLKASDETATISIANDWIIGARARLGMEIGNVMPYATAGVAWARFSGSATDGETTASLADTQRLWVIGGGIDYSVPATNLIAGISLLQYFEGTDIKDGLTTVRASLSVKLN